MNEFQTIRAALAAHFDLVVDLIAAQMACLGSKVEWAADDNFDITKNIARLAARIGLPGAGDQAVEALTFNRAAAAHLDFEVNDDA